MAAAQRVPGSIARSRRYAAPWRMKLLSFLLAVYIPIQAHGASGLDDITDRIQGYVKLLQRLNTYRPELPPQLLSQSVGFQGDRSRLDLVLGKLIQGAPVSMALLGGSISLRGWNHADESYISQVHKWLELTFVEGCRAKAEQASGRGGRKARQARDTGMQDRQELGRAQDQQDLLLPQRRSAAQHQYMEDPRPDKEQDLHVESHAGYLTQGHMCAGSKIKLRNLAVPAAGPGYVERCALQKLPSDVDLVLLDLSCNDYFEGVKFNHPERRAFERIVRRVLSLRRRPAVLALESFSWLQAAGGFYTEGKLGSLAQDKHNVITDYYGEVQVLSVRAALYQLMNGSSDPKRLIYIGDLHGQKDLLHVSLLGHRWYADIIISYLRDVARDVISRLIAAAGIRAAEVLAPGAGPGAGAAVNVVETGTGGHTADMKADTGSTGARASSLDEKHGYHDGGGGSEACSSVQGSRGVSYPVTCVPAADGAGLPLPPPFFKGNELHPFGVCAVGEDLQVLAAGPHNGWDWVDESDASSPFRKWGFVSDKVGAELSLSLSAPGSSRPSALLTPATKVKAWLIFLQSYTSMGRAEVSCTSGCSCDPFELDAHTGVRASMPALAPFDVQVQEAKAGQAADCRVRVQVLPESSSDGHKFKVVGVTTSATSIWHIDSTLKQDTLA